MRYMINNVGGKVIVDGHKLKIKEYPDVEFFNYKVDRGYFICEKTTGLALAWGKKLKVAKREAIRRMDSMTYTELAKVIAAKLKQYGFTN